MTAILISAGLALFLSLFATPLAIRLLRSRGIGQHIREDGPRAHFAKRGTPTMGGAIIIAASAVGYLAAHVRLDDPLPVSASGLLALGAMVSLGVVGFVDDLLKVRRRRSLGLRKGPKLAGQAFVAGVFGIGAAAWSSSSSYLSVFRPGLINLGVLFLIWVLIMMAAASNGVNLTDGLDGLACGSAAMVMGAYMFIAFWQFRHSCALNSAPGCYDVAHALDIATFSAAVLGACLGFLWWNAAPARIFMGDTGALALGGAMGSLAILTNTHLLLIILGGLYVVEVASVLIQVVSFRLFRRRVFLMAPIHHHFELLGWPEFTVIVRFWILGALSVGFGLALFYADFIAAGGVE